MDNDNEIKSEPGVNSNKVLLFLHENIRAIRHDDQKTYNLENEFAKTRKNKDYFVVLVLSIAVAVILAGAWIITAQINESSRNVPVDITVFEDLNLKNVLDLAKKAEDNLNRTISERTTLETDLQTELSNLLVQKKSELDIISVQKLTDTERKRRQAIVQKTYTEKESVLRASFQTRFAAVEGSIQEAEKQVASFDTKRVEEARSQKILLNNQQDLFELEKRKIQTSYMAEIADLRKRMAVIQNENAKLKSDQITELINEYQSLISTLDPLFQDVTSDSYIETVGLYPDAEVPFRNIFNFIPPDFSFISEYFGQMTVGYEGIDYLLSKVAAIPFENEAGNYVLAARKMAFLLGDASEKALGSSFSLIADLEKKNIETGDLLVQAKHTLDEIEHALDDTKLSLVNTANALDDSQTALEQSAAELENALQIISFHKKVLADSALERGFEGYVTGLQNVQTPELFLPSAIIEEVFAQQTPVVYAYRDAKTLIATLLLSRNGTGISAVVEKLEKSRELMLMDYITLKKK